jgi:hypothetical protein
MRYLVRSALPFTLTLMAGLMLAAALGTWHSREWGHRHRVTTVLMAGDYQHDWTSRSCPKFRRPDSMPAWTPMTPDDARINAIPPSAEVPSSPVRVISYSNVGTSDGEPVTRDASITSLPSPRFWSREVEMGQSPTHCNAMLRVTLGSSGKVTDVTVLPGSEWSGTSNLGKTPYLDDLMTAARGIRFEPAMRGGQPVSQQITVLYRQQ